MKKKFDNPTWWHYTGLFLLLVIITTVTFCIFSFCVQSNIYTINSNVSFVLKFFISTVFHTNDDFGHTLALAYMTTFSLVASWWFAGAALLGIAIGLFQKYSLRIFIWGLVISILPMVNLIVLHFMGI